MNIDKDGDLTGPVKTFAESQRNVKVLTKHMFRIIADDGNPRPVHHRPKLADMYRGGTLLRNRRGDGITYSWPDAEDVPFCRADTLAVR